MSAPELGDAVERADIESRVRKWSKKLGGAGLPPHAVLRQKLNELEAKAVYLGRKAEKHRFLQYDEAASPYQRALAARKFEDYHEKHDKALRVCALLEEKCRSMQPVRSSFSSSSSMAGVDSLLLQENLIALGDGMG